MCHQISMHTPNVVSLVLFFSLCSYIIQNIVDSIDKSRSILIVLSPNLASSDWCEFELSQVIFSQAPLLPVLLSELREAEITYPMRAVMSTTTYVKWVDRRHAIEPFWKLVQQVLDTFLKKYN